MSRDAPAARDRLSDDEEESGQEDEEEEEEEAPRKWRGIEAVFEAYQEYVDGESETPTCFCFSQIEALRLKEPVLCKSVLYESVLRNMYFLNLYFINQYFINQYVLN